MIPVPWLRAVIGLFLAPFLIDANLVGSVRKWVSTPTESDPTGSDETDGTDDAQGDLLISTFGTAIPKLSRKVPSEAAEQNNMVEQSDVTEKSEATELADEQQAEEDQHLNRASRRAQQREDAHAWRCSAANSHLSSSSPVRSQRSGLCHVQR